MRNHQIFANRLRNHNRIRTKPSLADPHKSHVFKNMLFVVFFHVIGHTGGARVLTLACAWAATATSRNRQPPSCQLLSTGGPGLAS